MSKSGLRQDRALNTPPLSHEQINQLLISYRDTGQQHYLGKLVTGMYNLQIACALRFASGDNLPDLVQEATIGLIKAANTYSIAKLRAGKGRFAPYAKKACTIAILESLQKNSRLMRLPKEILYRSEDIFRQAEAIAHEHEREYFTPDMLCASDDSGRRIAAGITDTHQQVSDPTSNHAHAHTHQPNPDRRTLSNALLNLPPGERQIIELYYSQDEPDYRRHLQDIRIPQEHAHKLHEQGLARLKLALNCPPV